MIHTLPPLPYAKDALAPIISAETLGYHYGKHHQTYVDNLNRLIVGTEFADSPLEQIALKAHGPIFNNAAQVWNHTFYWNGLKPNGGGEPSGELGAAIATTFGSFSTFKQQFIQAAVGLFGSGWAWLVKKSDRSLAIVQTSNAANPMTFGDTPLLTCDVWEHAYYIDYRNARAKYVEAFFNLINWDAAGRNFNR
ncbi:MAG: superoxide dismutase [Planctomycetota bacterium]|nr:superoxide dismutase [Planctomycetota bacterium]